MLNGSFNLKMTMLHDQIKSNDKDDSVDGSDESEGMGMSMLQGHAPCKDDSDGSGVSEGVGMSMLQEHAPCKDGSDGSDESEGMDMSMLQEHARCSLCREILSSEGRYDNDS